MNKLQDEISKRASYLQQVRSALHFRIGRGR